MNQALKYGLIALLIYIIITPTGLFMDQYISRIFTENIGISNIVETLGQVMAGTLFPISGIIKVDVAHSVGGFIISFLIGALIWFIIGFILGWLIRNKQTKEEKLDYIGKILMILGVVIFVVPTIISLIYDFMTNPNNFHKGSPIIAAMLYLMLAAPPFLIGLVLKSISKWMIKKKQSN